MPKEYYADKWWGDMPEKAQKAAKSVGYTKETWDADAKIPYDDKTFFQCSETERQAAMFLGLDPIKKKLNLWWDDVDKATQEQALALGWTKELWDDDWEIEDLPIDKVSWADLDKKQQKAANHFGYTKATWDETWTEEDLKTNKIFIPPSKNHPDKKPLKTPAQGMSETKTDEKEDSSKWNVLDSCCFAPYKVLFAPATKLAQVISHHKK